MRHTLGFTAAMMLLAPPAVAQAVPAPQRPDSARTDTTPQRPPVSKAILQAALELIGLSYTDAELDLLLQVRGQGGNDFAGRGDRRASYEAIRGVAEEDHAQDGHAVFAAGELRVGSEIVRRGQSSVSS